MRVFDDRTYRGPSDSRPTRRLSSPPVDDQTLGQYTGWEIAAAFAGGVFFSLLVALVLGLTSGLEAATIGAVVAQSVGSLGVLWLIAKLRRRGLESLAFSIGSFDWLFVAVGIGVQIALALVFYPITVRLVEEGPVQNLQPIIEAAKGVGARAFLILGIVVLAPLTEELLFRGALLHRVARRRGVTSGVVVSSLVFATLHAASLAGQDLETVVKSGLVALPQLFLVGVILGWLTIKTGRIGPAIFTHIGFNLVAVVILLAAPNLEPYL